MTNAEFSILMNLPKVFDVYTILPGVGLRGRYNLHSLLSEDKFILDVSRSGRIEIKYTIQDRYTKTGYPLVRIDINGPTHTNPDGVKKSRNHIHIFKEENEMGNLPWAYELNEVRGLIVPDVEFMTVFDAFCAFCNIDTANVQRLLL